jgi:alkanesulfonate monooxygenase SsuD/methylene tetrahydromethanopterin reductase-like flavin-dependent oxidoreductase (luciferase family)
MALQIENISRGRFAINLVNAWNRPELEKAGIEFAKHDERYAYGREWISVVKPLSGGERVSFTGRHFNVDDYELLPHDLYRARPTIYLGGEAQERPSRLGSNLSRLPGNRQGSRGGSSTLGKKRSKLAPRRPYPQ